MPCLLFGIERGLRYLALRVFLLTSRGAARPKVAPIRR
jgi:hypothetical protein